MTSGAAHPTPSSLSVTDAVALVVGVVVGAGIFRTPAVVAGAAGSEAAVLLVWTAGGVLSLAGALCYAELASTYPHVGGDYHFLHRAIGPRMGFLFAWSRIAVIQTGSIALQAFIVGDYGSRILRLGPWSSAILAGTAVVLTTGLNVAGLRQGTRAQAVLTATIVGGLVLLAVSGWAFAEAPPRAPERPPSGSGLGLAMIFVFLTYGGWNEAAYLSAEVRAGGRGIVRTLITALAIITGLYLLANAALLSGLGLEGLAGSEASAADLMGRAFGPGAAGVVGLLVAVAALSTMNATVFTGARTTYALARTVPALEPLGRWDARANAPLGALLAQGAVALALVALGAITRQGFTTMVEYTAPVFWFFFLLVGLSVFVLRRRDPTAERPFRVPLYPLTPAVFCATAAWMLWSSLAYTGLGALVGVAVLVAGLPLMWAARGRPERSTS